MLRRVLETVDNGSIRKMSTRSGSYGETRRCWWSVGVSAILDRIWQKKEVEKVWESNRIDTIDRRMEDKIILELSKDEP